MAEPDFVLLGTARRLPEAEQVHRHADAETAAPAWASPGQSHSGIAIGRADDPAERDAEDTASRIVDALRRRAAPPVQPPTSPTPPADGVAAAADGAADLRRSVDGGATRSDGGDPGISASAGRAGGGLEAGLAGRIDGARRRGGSPLPGAQRSAMEGAFGADFGGVRLHRGAEASQLSRSVGAQAFTLGSDIFFADRAVDLGSESGARLLAHELTHTLQNRGGVSRSIAPTIRRDIGFEFETQNVLTKDSTTGNPPNAAFADGNAADTMWNAAAPLTKADVLLKRPDIEITADDAAGGMGTDLEVVVTHLPETAAGRLRLVNAMADLQLLIGQFGAVQRNFTASSRALAGTGGFALGKKKNSLIRGNWAAAPTAPQVTMGLRLSNVENIVEDLHAAPGETAGEKATRDPGRRRMRRDHADAVNHPNEPRNLGALDDASLLVTGLDHARTAIAAYQVIDNTAPTDNGLTGFLTIVYAYVEAMPRKMAFLKSKTPLMAKTDLAAAWQTLPAPIKTFYAQVDPHGVTKLEDLIATTPGYGAKLPLPLFHGVGGMIEDDQAMGLPQWYHSLTFSDWVRSIVVERAKTKSEQFRDFLFGNKVRGGVDTLTNKSFPGRPDGQEIEGYGVLGSRMDTDATTQAKLPVFELRSPSRPMTYAQAATWATDMFDYVVSLNAHPGGGYQHIV